MMYSKQLRWLSSPRISASTNTVRTVLGSGKPSTEPFAIDLIKVVFPVNGKCVWWSLSRQSRNISAYR